MYVYRTDRCQVCAPAHPHSAFTVTKMDKCVIERKEEAHLGPQEEEEEEWTAIPSATTLEEKKVVPEVVVVVDAESVDDNNNSPAKTKEEDVRDSVDVVKALSHLGESFRVFSRVVSDMAPEPRDAAFRGFILYRFMLRVGAFGGCFGASDCPGPGCPRCVHKYHHRSCALAQPVASIVLVPPPLFQTLFFMDHSPFTLCGVLTAYSALLSQAQEQLDTDEERQTSPETNEPESETYRNSARAWRVLARSVYERLPPVPYSEDLKGAEKDMARRATKKWSLSPTALENPAHLQYCLLLLQVMETRVLQLLSLLEEMNTLVKEEPKAPEKEKDAVVFEEQVARICTRTLQRAKLYEKEWKSIAVAPWTPALCTSGRVHRVYQEVSTQNAQYVKEQVEVFRAMRSFQKNLI
jgi:hypothetical protein